LLCLVRDRAGEKPLYFARDGTTIFFSSELKPLIAAVPASRDTPLDKLFSYLALRYVPAPDTLLAGVEQLLPGTALLFSPGGERAVAWHAYTLSEQRWKDGEESYLDALEDALTTAARRRLASDVPLGCLLSSGVDSSLVCAILSKSLNRSVRCYSAGFYGDPHSETTAAARIAQHLELPFEALHIDEGELLETAGSLGNLLDEPNGDRGCVPMHLICRQARRHVTVALTGDGGDELFGGYSRYRFTLPDSAGPLERVAAYFDQALPVFGLPALQAALPQSAPDFARRFLGLYAPLFQNQDLSSIERLRVADYHSYLPGAVLAKSDRMSMRHALELRTPFLAPEVLELSAQPPTSLQADGRLKPALRQLLARYLPADLISSKKQGFGMPQAFFARHPLVFQKLMHVADTILRSWKPMLDQPKAFELLSGAARSNINSQWAWITLAQWINSLPPLPSYPMGAIRDRDI
jgi:asparagine synthase (glutamine-hydrolysing)